MDDDWDNLPTISNPPAAPAAPFGDDDFGGAGFGETPAPAGGGFEGFGDAPPAHAAPVQMEGFGGDNGFGGDTLFGEAPAAAPAPLATPIDFTAMGDAFGAPTPAPVQEEPPLVAAKKPRKPMSNNNVIDNCDTSALDKWEEEHREALKKKRLASQEKKTASLAGADKAVADLNDQRKKAIEANRKKNRDAEGEFVRQRDAALQAGLKSKESWEKVSSYLDLSADPKRSLVVSRMKSILLAVKSHPPTEVRNFGA